MVKTVIPPSRDQRRETIMSVAREVFFEHGYGGTSMSAIAARLGGSKGTLYNYFKSKEELFEAQVRDLCDSPAGRLHNAVGGEAPPEQALSEFGRDYLRHLYSEQTVKLFRILVAEAQRIPELARLFWEVGPARGKKWLAEYFAAARSNGFLEVVDCELAADQFLNLCKGTKHLQFLLNLIPAITEEEIREQIAQAVDAFMCLYGSKTAEGSKTAARENSRAL
jgi:AcrR family transcriptional regulator